jgi:hypothetical protein
VVSQWQSAPFAQADPAVARASAESHIEGFLQARVDGQGAEGFVPTEVATEVPLLYTTTGGARFERFEIELVGPLHWPDAGGMYRIRLFAQGGDTVVEQWVETGSGAAAPFWIDARRTTENGQPLAQPLVFMDGQVSLDAPFPWWYNGDFFHWYGLDRGGQGGRTVFHIEPMWHPLPVGEGCATGAEPANAEALAQAIASDPDLVTSTPLPVALNGRGALTLDIALAPGASTCELGSAQGTYVLTRELCCGRRGVTIADGSRMRLWLVDAPTGSSVGILALAIVAPPERFDAVLEAAAPILDTLEFPVP